MTTMADNADAVMYEGRHPVGAMGRAHVLLPAGGPAGAVRPVHAPRYVADGGRTIYFAHVPVAALQRVLVPRGPGPRGRPGVATATKGRSQRRSHGRSIPQHDPGRGGGRGPGRGQACRPQRRTRSRSTSGSASSRTTSRSGSGRRWTRSTRRRTASRSSTVRPGDAWDAKLEAAQAAEREPDVVTTNYSAIKPGVA